MERSDDFVVVLVTAPPEAAERLARTLVEEKLAACVNRLGGVRSTYRWKGTIEDAVEDLLLAKTRRSLTERLEARVREVHPYEVPEVIVLPITAGSKAYLEWLGDATGGE
ncbi:MAG: divalent-cation tolerance protein CutA [Candidatus Eisenbacteria bacterium]